MQHVRIRVTAHGKEAEIHPVYDIWANADYVDRSWALQWNNSGDRLGILHYAHGKPDPLEAAIRDIPEVLGYDIQRVGDEAFYVYLQDATTESLGEMFGSLTAGALIVVPPIVYHEDGRVTVSLFGPDDRLQAAVEGIPDPVEVQVEAVGGLEAAAPGARTSVTERQREAVEAALERGYYDVPRTADHEDVADAIDCAPSTAAEHLRKAEAAVVAHTFDR